MSSPEILRDVPDIPPIPSKHDNKLINETAEVATFLLNRHINPARYSDPVLRAEMPTPSTYIGENPDLWTPAMYIPWSVGKNLPKDYKWTSEDTSLPEATRTALLINLLTEDNLPWYTLTIQTKNRASEPLGFFNRIWTAEEDRHSEVLRAGLHVFRVIDPIELDSLRMVQMIGANVPEPESAVELAVYVTMQELATRISHMNTGILIEPTALKDTQIHPLVADGTELANQDPEIVSKFTPEEMAIYTRQVFRAIMNRISKDETKHFVFYRDFVKDGALPINPSLVVRALERQIKDFEMPGTGIPDFRRHAVNMANSGIYDIPQHLSKIIKPVLKYWDIENLEGLDSEGEIARQQIYMFVDDLEKKSTKFVERRDAKRQKAIDEGSDEIWIGK